MRLNKYIAVATGMSRRAADAIIETGRVSVNDKPSQTGQDIGETDVVKLDSRTLELSAETQTYIFNKPVGYVVSRDGQGSKTIYDVLPRELHHLKPIGRLDKESSGLLLLTNDGALAHELTHPSYQKLKLYEISLLKPLKRQDMQAIEQGVELEDGISKLSLKRLGDDKHWQVSMHEGRNRQIRRTFAALGYTVTTLHRTHFGPFELNDLPVGELKLVTS
jgi:23S rRNA pseudouridine2605 synthase